MSDVASPPRPIPSLLIPGTIDGRNADSDSIICRAEIETEIKPLTWLSERTEDELLYWANRDGGDETAAAGVLVRVSGSAASGTASWMQQIDSHLHTAAAGVRFYGGTRFDLSSPAAPEWKMLGGYRFVVPRYEAVTRDGLTLLACNFFPAERDRLPELLTTLLHEPLPRPTVSPPVRLRRHADAPDRSNWETLIEIALRTINNPADPLTKVVMARCTEATASSPITPQALLNAMSRVDDHSFRFLVQTCPKTAFTSVTPERLFSLNGRTVQTEAIAGTRPRGATSEDDRRLKRELSASVKDRLEHRIVHDSIAAVLSNLCTEIRASEVTILSLPKVQHLMSQFSGELAAGLSAADLVDALHPTPAVGGSPTAAARRFLTDHEPFDRGWYAAPVGWVGQGEATFAVAIRSALINDGIISFFTGNGVVAGSSPDVEWSELEAKIGCYFDSAD